jgi:hypothetical protein
MVSRQVLNIGGMGLYPNVRLLPQSLLLKHSHSLSRSKFNFKPGSKPVDFFYVFMDFLYLPKISRIPSGKLTQLWTIISLNN